MSNLKSNRQKTLADRERKRAKLTKDFNKWIRANCIGWDCGVTRPEFNFIGHKNAKQYAFVNSGLDQFLVPVNQVPEKFRPALGLYTLKMKRVSSEKEKQ